MTGAISSQALEENVPSLSSFPLTSGGAVGAGAATPDLGLEALSGRRQKPGSGSWFQGTSGLKTTSTPVLVKPLSYLRPVRAAGTLVSLPFQQGGIEAALLGREPQGSSEG